MPPAIVEILIEAAASIGVEVTKDIFAAVQSGRVNTVKLLSQALPDAHQIALADEALIVSQRMLAHGGAL